jgi:hypothetical protein
MLPNKKFIIYKKESKAKTKKERLENKDKKEHYMELKQ